jgi:hypothetical protein
MSLRRRRVDPLPEETARVARAAFPAHLGHPTISCRFCRTRREDPAACSNRLTF